MIAIGLDTYLYSQFTRIKHPMWVVIITVGCFQTGGEPRFDKNLVVGVKLQVVTLLDMSCQLRLVELLHE